MLTLRVKLNITYIVQNIFFDISQIKELDITQSYNKRRLASLMFTIELTLDILHWSIEGLYPESVSVSLMKECSLCYLTQKVYSKQPIFFLKKGQN